MNKPIGYNNANPKVFPYNSSNYNSVIYLKAFLFISMEKHASKNLRAGAGTDWLVLVEFKFN